MHTKTRFRSRSQYPCLAVGCWSTLPVERLVRRRQLIDVYCLIFEPCVAPGEFAAMVQSFHVVHHDGALPMQIKIKNENKNSNDKICFEV